jgi:peroxiredoxin
MKGQLLKTGDVMPEFAHLPGVDGKKYSSPDFRDKNILVIVFSCNHCPYVQAYEDRMISLQKEYSPRGVEMVAINSNNIANYPDDDFEGMVKRAKQKGFNFPYLRDDDQSSAESFGATHTPQFFVFNRDRKLCYSGKMDDNWQEPSLVKERYLRNALDELLSGRQVSLPETFSIGCTIKWK